MSTSAGKKREVQGDGRGLVIDGGAAQVHKRQGTSSGMETLARFSRNFRLSGVFLSVGSEKRDNSLGQLATVEGHDSQNRKRGTRCAPGARAGGLVNISVCKRRNAQHKK